LALGDRLMKIDGVDVTTKSPDEIVAMIRDIGPTEVVPVSVERSGNTVDIEVNCSNARHANEARLNILKLTSQGKFDECVKAVSGLDELGTEAAILRLRCASVAHNPGKYNVPELTFQAMRMIIEDARWAPTARAEAIERLRAVEGSINQNLGASRFQQLVSDTKSWPGGERMFDASEPDWALFRRNSEIALRDRMVDPDSARIEWPYGFLLGSWRPLFSLKQIDGYWTCGLINARNRMGGYNGSAPFVIVLDRPGTVKFVDVSGTDSFEPVRNQCNLSVKMLPPPQLQSMEVATAPPGQSTSVADELKKLVDLKNSGALTDAEFQAAKSRLLGTSGR
jgi:hypothetical protein